MKTQNKKKIVVSALAIAMGAALAGSISGSVAWYQYSTKAAAIVAGTTIGTMGRLQVSTNASTGFDQYLDLGTGNFKPISASRTSAGVMSYYDHPVYQVEKLPELTTGGYIDYTVYFQYEESTDGSTWTAESRNIYLSHFAIVDAGSAEDVTDAVRVEFRGSHNFLLSSAASGAGLTTATSGNLDLNDNDELDTMEWDCQDAGSSKITYINGTSESYTADAHDDVLVEVDDTNIYTLDEGNSDKILVATGSALTIRIWLEGWALLNGSADWSADYLAQSFAVQMQFACHADR